MNSETFTKNVIDLQKQIKRLQSEEMITQLNDLASGNWKFIELNSEVYYTMIMNDKTFTYFPDTNSFYVGHFKRNLYLHNISPEEFQKEYRKIRFETFI